MPIFPTVLPHITLKILFPLCLCGKPRSKGDQAAMKPMPGTARSPALWRHGCTWGPSAHKEISEGNVHRSVERSCPCLRLNPAAVEHPHYSYRSWDTYMTKSTRKRIRGKLKQHAESSYPPCLQSTNRLQHPLWLLLLLFLTCCYAAFMSAQRTKPQLATKYMY